MNIRVHNTNSHPATPFTTASQNRWPGPTGLEGVGCFVVDGGVVKALF
ncbi:MAG: hypothetical protein M3Z85_17975 [Acidobacteriota bacterium]|nr:hypothetical protein [Acidobacteriota bacterium]